MYNFQSLLLLAHQLAWPYSQLPPSTDTQLAGHLLLAEASSALNQSLKFLSRLRRFLSDPGARKWWFEIIFTGILFIIGETFCQAVCIRGLMSLHRYLDRILVNNL